VEQTEAQYLVINALETLRFIFRDAYDRETGIWYIETSSLSLPIAQLMQNGEVLPVEFG
jgi:hypothetical protein